MAGGCRLHRKEVRLPYDGMGFSELGKSAAKRLRLEPVAAKEGRWSVSIDAKRFIFGVWMRNSRSTIVCVTGEARCLRCDPSLRCRRRIATVSASASLRHRGFSACSIRPDVARE